jgi:hypothetical protein
MRVGRPGVVSAHPTLRVLFSEARTPPAGPRSPRGSKEPREAQSDLRRGLGRLRRVTRQRRVGIGFQRRDRLVPVHRKPRD